MKKTKRTIMTVMGGCLIGSVASAGTITKSATAPTGYFASGAIDAGNYTRVFGDGARTSDYNEGRGNEIIADSGSYAGFLMDALVIRKDAAQDFSGTTATLTLYVFEGTKEQWDAGNGQSSGDNNPFDGTVISTIYKETFALDGSYAEGDYVSLNLDTPITMGANMGFFIKMTQGNATDNFFQIVQKNSDVALSNQDGWQYQAPSSGNFHTGSPLEYYAVGTEPPPSGVIADYGGEFPAAIGAGPEFDGTEAPATGWSYLWNPTGGIGVAADYRLLVPNTVSVSPQGGGPLFTGAGNIAFNDAAQGDFRYGRLAAPGSSSHPGQGGADYRVIIGYTVQPGEGGAVEIVESSLRKDAAASAGIDLDVFVNDTRVAPLSLDGFNSATATAFDGALGSLSAGDTVYVTVGHNGDPGGDAFYIDFKLGRMIDPDADRDGDGLKDAWERDNFGDLDETGAGNPDGDGLDNAAEESAGTDPNLADTDADGLADEVEVAGPTDPLDPDSDDDNLPDGVETHTGVFVSSNDTGTNPMLKDSDDDGISDGAEMALGSDPNDATDLPAERPNIIFIMVDDLDIRQVGAYGQLSVATPELDTLASQGMRFTDYYTASPVCQACRSCLLTGQDSRRAQDRHNGEFNGYQYPLNPTRVTIAEVLRQAGYTSGCVGKWGLGGPGSGSEPWNQGFDFFSGYLGQVQAHKYYPQYLWKFDHSVSSTPGKIYFNQTLANAEGGSLYIPGANNPNAPTDSGWGASFGNVCSHDVAVKEGLEFITANANRPFFLFCAWTPPHLNYFPAASLAALEDADGLVYNPTDHRQTLVGEVYLKPPYVPAGAPGSAPAPFGGTVANPDYQPHAYASAITGLSRDTGRILAKLNELGIEDRTLVIFCSDNGGGENGLFVQPSDLNGVLHLRDTKRSVYEGGIRSPFLVRWPGVVPAGTDSGVVGTFADMLPTFAEIAGVGTPAGITGRSILPALLGGTESDLQPRSYHYWYFTEGTRRTRAVRQGDWKLVRQRATDGSPPTYELFNLATDLYETTDLSWTETAIRDRLIPLVEGTHEPADAMFFKVNDEFFTKTNLTESAFTIAPPDGTGRGNGYRLAPSGTGSCFNYLPFAAGLNERATFGWTMQFPSGGTAALLLGPANVAAQCFKVRIDSSTLGVTVSEPGGGSAAMTLTAADFPGNRAECHLTVDPASGAGTLTIGSTSLPFDVAAALGPFFFWGYEVAGAALECSRPQWTTGAAGSARARIFSGAGMIGVDYSLPALLGEEGVPQYSSDLIHWFDNPPGLLDLRAAGSQNGGEGLLLLPADSLLPHRHDQLFLRIRSPR